MPKTPANVHTICTATIYIHTSFSYIHIHHIFTLIPTKNIYTYIFTKGKSYNYNSSAKEYVETKNC